MGRLIQSLPTLFAQHSGGAPITGLNVKPEPEAYSVLLWAGLIVVAAILMGILSLAIRKRLLRPDEADAGGTIGFTLADLRRMHEDGQMTDDEYIQAKRRLIANARSQFADDEEDEADQAVHLESESDGDADGPGEEYDENDDDPDVPF